jgi:1A family penicillin-binding protein
MWKRFLAILKKDFQIVGHELRHISFKRIQQWVRWLYRSQAVRNFVILCGTIVIVGAGALLILLSTVSLPTLNSFSERKVSQSTKIYDRTGNVLLYDVHQEIRRTVVPFEKISEHIKHATVAIEDDTFYSHFGVRPVAFLRAAMVNVSTGEYSQGGSTITQQVVKNTLLNPEKTITRKMKEWVLAILLEQKLTKDEILSIYLNEVPYGGPIYGIQEASQRYFGKDATDVSIAQAAYLAALPQAPTYFSPYGNHTDKLEQRKNLVLSKMYEQGYISRTEYETSKSEIVEFNKQDTYGIKAPHFVFLVKERLEEMYGRDVVETEGLKVITSLDFELQKEAERIVKEYASENVTKFNAENAALVAIDPRTGEILSMVGSRDYFDDSIDGAFNIATAHRQPGSSFKPFVYATAFSKGYRPETVVYDVPTEFSAVCGNGGSCYSPGNYDDKFRGPISLRNALAQSINIPAVKLLYLVGINDAIAVAKSLGIESLTDPDRYGLTMVLGGGEVSLLELVSAYGGFANTGVYNPEVAILKVEGAEGDVMFEHEDESERALNEQTALLVNDVLSDGQARAGLFAAGGAADFGAREVALKTGTTNDYRDVWIVGYTPDIVVGAWAGNNDNSPMVKKVAGLIIAPLWRAFMDIALEKFPETQFPAPFDMTDDVKPVIKGEIDTQNPHEILHYVNKEDPLGSEPSNPGRDPQYWLWEQGMLAWYGNTATSSPVDDNGDNPSGFSVLILNPSDGDSYYANAPVLVAVGGTNGTIVSADVYINRDRVGSIDTSTMSFEFIPQGLSSIRGNNRLRVVATSDTGEKAESTINFKVIDAD